ncbi:MAG: 1-acyl-sn-glycerol-3-phosphate acyltransferase [bacterium]|nr:1-acyl-sn-glycerol-3-phosphate acyltransferase [bacterium]
MNLIIRSFIFHILFWVTSVSMLLILFVLSVIRIPMRYSCYIIHWWGLMIFWILKWCNGITYEIRGRENLPEKSCVIAAKHQSAWDTIIYLTLFKNPAMVLKKELMMAPIYSTTVRHHEMIVVDRKRGMRALIDMVQQASKALSKGRHVVIFPEGTRSAPGSKTTYQPGIAGLYSKLDCPVVPVAVNSGVFWPRRTYIRHPGRIVLEFLPAIEPGLDRKTFMKRLENDIETATDRLLLESGGLKK